MALRCEGSNDSRHRHEPTLLERRCALSDSYAFMVALLHFTMQSVICSISNDVHPVMTGQEGRYGAQCLVSFVFTAQMMSKHELCSEIVGPHHTIFGKLLFPRRHTGVHVTMHHSISQHCFTRMQCLDACCSYLSWINSDTVIVNSNRNSAHQTWVHIFFSSPDKSAPSVQC